MAAESNGAIEAVHRLNPVHDGVPVRRDGKEARPTARKYPSAMAGIRCTNLVMESSTVEGSTPSFVSLNSTEILTDTDQGKVPGVGAKAELLGNISHNRV